MLLIHAFTGCDTTSRIYGVGKDKLFEMANNIVNGILEAFYAADSTANHIREVDEKLLLQLLTLTAPTLDAARVITLEQRTLSLTSHIKCQQLPPTSSASQQHSYRVFLQIQEWNEHNLDPVLWGWKRKNGQYIPVPTMKAAAPNELLQTIHCAAVLKVGATLPAAVEKQTFLVVPPV